MSLNQNGDSETISLINFSQKCVDRSFQVLHKTFYTFYIYLNSYCDSHFTVI